MPTLFQLITDGHRRFRKPFWHRRVYLRVELPAGVVGRPPWGDLHDPCGPAPVPGVSLLMDHDQDWEAYTGELWREAP